MLPSSRSDSPRDVGVVIAAAGAGERAGPGVLKQFRPIAGIPMLLRAIRPFAQHPRVGSIVVALPQPFADDPPSWLAEVVGQGLRLVAGGATRTDTVRAALAALDPDIRLVLVHDAARPFVSTATIEAVIAVASEGRGAVPAVPVADTLKRAAPASSRIAETVDRDGLWRAHTPQGFPREMLEAALRAAGTVPGQSVTDEATLVEAAGYAVHLVPDDAGNCKITTPDDFVLAEALARR